MFYAIETIETMIADLQAIDFGYLETAGDREVALTFLETIADELDELDLWFPQTDLAIRFFLTDPERARTYLYGPTDVRDGMGLIEKLKQIAADLRDEIDAEQFWR